MSPQKSTQELLKEVIYKWLSKDFSRIEAALAPEMKTELDGILWVLAGKLSNVGRWEYLDSYSIEQFAKEIGEAAKGARA